jgi:hypothetical protein
MNLHPYKCDERVEVSISGTPYPNRRWVRRDPNDPEPTEPLGVPAGTRGKAFKREKCNCCVFVIFDKIPGLPRQVAKERLRRLSLLEAIAEAAL